ncbi:uncharacterized protein LOC109840508 [Asparagus officinalis]|uniref:uncharacterized protein LOC109840508 n=1 Tax=Asparagus officinalis TaxID=4686 RepID=UPI00098E1DC8|nr:uncharacterized protein LOC109840508 [Asparagus officinalis]
MVVASGNKTGTLYLTSHASDTLTITAGKRVWIWNNRLGHMGQKGMKILHSQVKLTNIDLVEVGICEDCIYEKQKRVRFQKSGRPPKAHKLELVYTDVWGPASVSYLGDSMYYTTFIDD